MHEVCWKSPKTEFQAMGEACKAIFCSTSGAKHGIFDVWIYTAKGIFISAFVGTQPKEMCSDQKITKAQTLDKSIRSLFGCQ